MSNEKMTTSPERTPPLSPTIAIKDIIPADVAGRTLVLCFDGTGDSFDADNSNVVQFFSMLQKDDHSKQMVYYQAGIGTYTVPQIATPFMAQLSKILDMMIAWNLDAHVMDGYDFLMQNYTAGDKICIFGFSRGAYTARALAGMLHKVGLLPQGNRQQLPFAYKMFTRTDATGWNQSTAFKKAFSMDVDVEFIGVWDTVSSVGIIPRHLPFTTSNSAIKTFRHAVSLDEHRSKFQANLFNWPDEHEEKLGTKPGDMPKAGEAFLGKFSRHLRKSSHESKHDCYHSHERAFTDHEGKKDCTDVLEVWFSGCHTDIGGGSVPNESRHNLARIPLRWMIRQCFLAKTGIRFHAEMLRAVGLDPATLYPEVISRPPALELSALASYATFKKPKDLESIQHAPLLSEDQEDLIDSICPIYDQLNLCKFWWSLEFWPLKRRVQDEFKKWHKVLTINLGRGRTAISFNHEGQVNAIHIHRSVLTRMKAHEYLTHGQYKPRAKIADLEINWVD